MIGERQQNALEVSRIQNEQPIEALSANGSHEPFGDAIRLRCLDRCPDYTNARALKDRVKARREFAVVIANEHAHRLLALGEGPGDLPRLLRDPRPVGMCRAASQVHAPTGDLDEEQHVQPTKPDGVDGEEIDGDDAPRLRTHELTPRWTGSCAGWAEVVLAEHLPNGRRRHEDAHAFQFANDALITPARILACQPDDQLSNVTADRRSAGPSRVGPAVRHQASVPAQKCRRRDQKRRPPDPRQHPTRGRQEQSVGRPKRRPTNLASQHRQLVAQDDDLEFLELSRAEQKQDQLQNALDRDVID